MQIFVTSIVFQKKKKKDAKKLKNKCGRIFSQSNSLEHKGTIKRKINK